jgi:hypothetical protein
MTTLTLDIAAFRLLFPQFASPTTFPDVKIQAEFGMATGYVSPDTYGDMPAAARSSALGLMTAHLLALGVIIAQNNYSGQVGIVTAATIDGVSITLAPPPQRGQWRWWLNTTPYGAQLVALLDAQAAGGFFIGGLPERSAFRRVGGGFGGVY